MSKLDKTGLTASELVETGFTVAVVVLSALPNVIPVEEVSEEEVEKVEVEDEVEVEVVVDKRSEGVEVTTVADEVDSVEVVVLATNNADVSGFTTFSSATQEQYFFYWIIKFYY